MKIAICVPVHGDVKAKFALSLAGLVGRMMVEPNTQLGVFFEEGGPIELKRTRLALTAKAGFDWLLWIDSDQTFPADGLLRLLAAGEYFIGCNIPTRHGTIRPTAHGLDGEPLMPGAGIQRVGAVGLGFCLVKTEVLDRIPAPWFASEISPDGRLVVGEDLHFCNQARSAGISVYVENDLSNDIGHIGERTVTLGEIAYADTALPSPGP